MKYLTRTYLIIVMAAMPLFFSAGRILAQNNDIMMPEIPVELPEMSNDEAGTENGQNKLVGPPPGIPLDLPVMVKKKNQGKDKQELDPAIIPLLDQLSRQAPPSGPGIPWIDGAPFSKYELFKGKGKKEVGPFNALEGALEFYIKHKTSQINAYMSVSVKVDTNYDGKYCEKGDSGCGSVFAGAYETLYKLDTDRTYKSFFYGGNVKVVVDAPGEWEIEIFPKPYPRRTIEGRVREQLVKLGVKYDIWPYSENASVKATQVFMKSNTVYADSKTDFVGNYSLKVYGNADYQIIACKSGYEVAKATIDSDMFKMQENPAWPIKIDFKLSSDLDIYGCGPDGEGLRVDQSDGALFSESTENEAEDRKKFTPEDREYLERREEYLQEQISRQMAMKNERLMENSDAETSAYDQEIKDLKNKLEVVRGELKQMPSLSEKTRTEDPHENDVLTKEQQIENLTKKFHVMFEDIKHMAAAHEKRSERILKEKAEEQKKDLSKKSLTELSEPDFKKKNGHEKGDVAEGKLAKLKINEKPLAKPKSQLMINEFPVDKMSGNVALDIPEPMGKSSFLDDDEKAPEMPASRDNENQPDPDKWGRIMVGPVDPTDQLTYEFHKFGNEMQETAVLEASMFLFREITGFGIPKEKTDQWKRQTTDFAIRAANRMKAGMTPEQQQDLDNGFKKLPPDLQKTFYRELMLTTAKNLIVNFRQPSTINRNNEEKVVIPPIESNTDLPKEGESPL